MNPETQRPFVSTYYGETLKSSADLKTSACCPTTAVPPKHREILSKLHPEVTTRFYGCGSPIPDMLSGTTILDLGCGTGRDAFLSAALAGPKGHVIGVDMTDSQLDVARRHAQYHADLFLAPGAAPNTDFRNGFIEDLTSADVADESVDVVISNCVCNLSPNKKAVFAEIARVLKQGGELYFSDVYADRRLSKEAREHPVLVAECLGGAMYLEDFRRVMKEVGFADVRVVSGGPIEVLDKDLKKLVQDVHFYSLTVRAFKIAELEDRRENYGQFAVYDSCCGDGLQLDIGYKFEKGIPLPVDANTAAILQKSRYSARFSVTSREAHQGLFCAETEGGALGAMISNTVSRLSRCDPGDAAVACCDPQTTENGETEAEKKGTVPGQVVDKPQIASEDKEGCKPGPACC